MYINFRESLNCYVTHQLGHNRFAVSYRLRWLKKGENSGKPLRAIILREKIDINVKMFKL